MAASIQSPIPTPGLEQGYTLETLHGCLTGKSWDAHLYTHCTLALRVQRLLIFLFCPDTVNSLAT
jgi:hypothetical protein